MSDISASEFVEKRSFFSDHILIDVRDRNEYLEWHLHGSINIPLKELTDTMPSLNSEVKYLLVCKSGFKSNVARSILEASGFNVSVIVGGIASIKPLTENIKRKEF